MKYKKEKYLHLADGFVEKNIYYRKVFNKWMIYGYARITHSLEWNISFNNKRAVVDNWKDMFRIKYGEDNTEWWSGIPYEV